MAKNKKPRCPVCHRRGGYVQLIGPPSRVCGAIWGCNGCSTEWRKNPKHKGGLEILGPRDIRTYTIYEGG